MKYSRYSYKQKMRLLGVALCILLLLCYQLSIKRSVEEYIRHSKLSQTFAGDFQGKVNLPELNTEKKQLDSAIDRYTLDTLDISKNLLGVVSEFCNSHELAIKEYKPVGITEQGSVSVFTRYISVEGYFRNCLQLIYQLETGEKTGRVASVNFKSTEEKSDGSLKLNCTIYVQNILR